MFSCDERERRPDIGSVIREVTAEKGLRVGVVACGPAEMIMDVRNGCAEAQGRILGGRAKGAREVWLYTEAFSW